MKYNKCTTPIVSIFLFLTLFVSDRASSQDPRYTRDCLEYFREAGVSPDATFSFCSSEAATTVDDPGVIRDCLEYFRKAGVSPNTAFDRCLSEIER